MPPLSEPRRRGQSTGCLVLFFGIFLAVGCALSYFLLWRPMSHFVAALSWQATPCTIESSQVAESSDSDGTTYKVAVTFTYAGSDGREYRSSRYDFLGVSSSGYDGKAAVVARYPAGARATRWGGAGQTGDEVSAPYCCVGVSSGGYDGKAAVVARYPAGARTTCWVDPENPGEAVLN